MLGKLEDWYLRHSLWFARRLLLALLLLVLVLAIVVLTRDNTLSVQVEPSVSPTAQANSLAEQESSALGTQRDQRQVYDERLLQTVYWSLGILAAVSVLLVGFNWFSSVRLADRDRKQLEEEIRAELRKEIDQIELRMQNRFDELEKEALAMVAARLSESEQQHQRDFSELQKGIAMTQLLLLETEARSQLGFGNLNGVLDTAVVMITIGLQVDEESPMPRGLELLQQVLRNGAQPTAAQAAEINSAIDHLPDKFSTDSSIVKDLLSEVRTRMNLESAWEG